MDKPEIKRLLREQVEPMSQAVAKKLAYLQSDDVFTEPGTQVSQEDNSLLEAFSGSAQPTSVSSYSQMSAREFYQNQQSVPQPKYLGNAPTQHTIEEHKQNIAAKIAALRGISMPGDYLRQKKL